MMRLIEHLKAWLDRLFNPIVVDDEERRRFERRELEIQARLEANRTRTDVITARHTGWMENE